MPDQPAIQVNRGAWLSGSNWANLSVNDTDELIICFTPAEDPFPLILTKDYTSEALPDVAGVLSEGQYAVEVRLISEAQGAILKTLNFGLTVQENPKLKIELIEIADSEASA